MTWINPVHIGIEHVYENVIASYLGTPNEMVTRADLATTSLAVPSWTTVLLTICSVLNCQAKQVGSPVSLVVLEPTLHSVDRSARRSVQQGVRNKIASSGRRRISVSIRDVRLRGDKGLISARY